MAYLNRSEFLDRYDARRVGALVSDDNTIVDKATLVLGSTVLDAVLADAESLINSALFASDRYQDSDLSELTGDDLAILKRLNADIAYGLLLRRRGYASVQIDTEAPGYAEALAYLTALREGDRILNIASARQAGKPKNIKLSTDINLVTEKSQRYFGDFINEALTQERPYNS